MRILALDTTAKTATAAISEDGKLTALYTINSTKTHSENMLPMVEELLKRTATGIENIDLFACSAGPGSFTGVRIGVSLVKGLAYGREVPCVMVSALEALARNACSAGYDGWILCPVMDARREQVYNALFSYESGALKRVTPDRAISKDELMKELAAYSSRPILFIGDGAYLFDDVLSDSICKASELLLWQNAYSVALCAFQMAQQGNTTSDAELQPVYLRSSQAERMKNEKEKEL